MSRTKEQKIKLLVLYDLLCKLTDEEHSLTTNEIIELLAEQGIDACRKVIPADIALLNEYGYEVLTEKGRSNRYYVVERKFESAEIAMLSEALKASKLTEVQKTQLLGKLEGSIGEHQADSIFDNLIFSDMPKRSNKNILRSADSISKAINEDKKISFLYYSLDENKQKVYHKDGKRYIVNPLVMVWNKDNYYLISYHDNHEGVTNYRIDRIDDVKVAAEERTPRAEYQNFNPERYRREVFSMFGGEQYEVELTFTSDMINDIYDKFGEDISITKQSENTYNCVLPIQASKTFYVWVAGSCGKVRIASPDKVKNEFQEFVDSIKRAY